MRAFLYLYVDDIGKLSDDRDDQDAMRFSYGVISYGLTLSRIELHQPRAAEPAGDKQGRKWQR